MDLDGEMRALALIADSAIKMYLTAVCVCVLGVWMCVLASKYLLQWHPPPVDPPNFIHSER